MTSEFQIQIYYLQDIFFKDKTKLVIFDQICFIFRSIIILHLETLFSYFHGSISKINEIFNSADHKLSEDFGNQIYNEMKLSKPRKQQIYDENRNRQ